MATWADVRRIALSLPEATEGAGADGIPGWAVRKKGFVWERPLRRREVAALGAAAPQGPILAAHVPDLGAKEALLADDPDIYFSLPHYDGYPAVLVLLDRVAVEDLEELIAEAWLAKAPRRLAQEWLDARA